MNIFDRFLEAYNRYCTCGISYEKEQNHLISVLKEIVSTVKVLKSAVVIITPNAIIGVDENCTFIVSMECPTDFYTMCLKEGIVAIYVKEAEKFIKDGDPSRIISMQYNNIESPIIEIYNTHKMAVMSNLVSPKYNLNDNGQFMSIVNGKAKDGAKIINIMGYPITVYSSLLPINKNDKIDLQFIEYGEKDFIGLFTITKKSVILEVFIKYLKFN